MVMSIRRSVIRCSTIVAAAALAFVVSAPVSAQQVSKPAVAGVTNFNQLETTVACAGATTPEAVPEIKKLGFKSIINLREPTENGANIEAEAAAAKTAGIPFFNIPFNSSKPDPTVADTFLSTITAPDNQPAFIHCASANRASAMWMIKRLVVDHWETDRAAQEAAALGLTNAALKQFALDYAQSHKQ
jgi:uncharacterized protein (TIGR01244 family)